MLLSREVFGNDIYDIAVSCRQKQLYVDTEPSNVTVENYIGAVDLIDKEFRYKAEELDPKTQLNAAENPLVKTIMRRILDKEDRMLDDRSEAEIKEAFGESGKYMVESSIKFDLGTYLRGSRDKMVAPPARLTTLGWCIDALKAERKILENNPKKLFVAYGNDISPELERRMFRDLVDVYGHTIINFSSTPKAAHTFTRSTEIGEVDVALIGGTLGSGNTEGGDGRRLLRELRNTHGFVGKTIGISFGYRLGGADIEMIEPKSNLLLARGINKVSS